VIHVFSGAALVLYLLSCGFFSRKRGSAGIVLAAIGVGLHLLSILLLPEPLRLDFGNFLSLLALVSVFAFLLLGRGKYRSLASAVMLLSVVLYTISAVVVHLEQPANKAEQSWNLVLLAHVASTFAGSICFLFCGFFSLAFLFQDRMLKKKRSLNSVYGFPSLRELNAVSVNLVTAGIWAMIAGFGIGFFYALDASQKIPVRDPKLLFSAITLLYFCILANSRGRFSESRFAKFSVLGVILLIASIVAATGYYK